MKKFIVCSAIGCVFSGVLWADDNLHIPGNYQESGFGEQREYQKGQANEYVDPFSGSLKRIYTDYVFANNGGMNINITRTYNTLQNAGSGQVGSLDNGKWATTSGGKASMGPGWDIHFGRIWLPMEDLGGGSLESRVIPAWAQNFAADDPRIPGFPHTPAQPQQQWYMDECHIGAWSSGGYANQLPVLELPDSSRQVLYPVILKESGSQKPLTAYITKNHWLATCLPYSEEIAVADGFPPHTQGGLVLYSPEGLRYVFNKKGALTGYGSTWGQGHQEGYVVTQISDLNGNTMNIAYERAPLADDSILRPVQVTSSSGGATVTVTFNYASSLLSSITGQGVTIEYDHDADQLLRQVKIDTGVVGDADLRWEYDYVPTNPPPEYPQHDAPFNLSRVVSPTGQVTEYAYDKQRFTQDFCATHYCDAAALDRHSNIVVKARSVDDVEWTYDYYPGDPVNPQATNDVTNVSASSGGKTICTAYEHIGEAATLGVIEGPLNRSRDLHRRGLLIEKRIYDGNCPGGGRGGPGVLMQTETMTYGKKAHITNLDDYRPYPATRDTRVWVPLLTQKQIVRNGKTYTSNYAYWGGDYDKDYDPLEGWEGSFVATNPLRSTTEVVAGQVNKVTNFGVANIFSIGSGVSPVLRYKVLQQATGVTDAGTTFATYKYFDSNGNQLAVLDHGIPTFYERHASGDIKKVVSWQNYYDMGCTTPPGSDVNGDGKITFDERLPGYLTCIAGKTSGMTLLQYYSVGVPASVTLPDGTTISRQLDSRGNIQQETVAKTGEVSTTSSYTYDRLNRLKAVTTPRTDDADVAVAYPSFVETELTRGRMTKTVTKNSRGLVELSCTAASDTADALCQNFAYDRLQNFQVFASDVSYSQTEMQGVATDYDVLGRVTSKGHTGKVPARYSHTVADQVSVLNRVAGIDYETRYSYRSYGNPDEKFLIKIEQEDSPGNYIVTDLVKNSVGRLSAVTQDGKTRTFYYASGKPLLVSREQNEYQDHGYCYNLDKLNYHYQGIGPFDCSSYTNLVSYQGYDKMERVSTQQYIAYGDAVQARWKYFTYDKFGNLKTASLDSVLPNANAKDYWQYSYDQNNNLLSETFTNHQDSPVVNYSFSYQYDNLDGLQQLTYPNGQKALYAPDGLGRATRLDYDDNAGNITPLVNAGGLSYFADGSIHTATLGNGHTMTRTQTPEKFLDTSTISGNVLSLDYDYDDIGNVIGVTDPNPDPLTNLGKSGFQYDGLSRLQAVTLADGNYSYSYNASGNITQKTTPQGACDYSYHATTALLTSVTGSCGETASAVQYDSLKNIRGKNGDVPYTYNSANQLVLQNGAFYAEYDGNGRRFRAAMQQWNLNGSGAFVNAPYLNLFSKSGQNLVEIDHRVDSGGGYVRKNYRNHVYFAGKRLISMDNCQANRNHALGVCGTEDEDGDGLSYLQELDKETFPFDRDSDRDGIPDFYDAFPTNANPVLPLEGAAGFKGSSISEHVEQL